MASEFYRVNGFGYNEGKSLYYWMQQHFPEFDPQQSNVCEYDDVFEFHMFGDWKDIETAMDLWAADIH